MDPSHPATGDSQSATAAVALHNARILAEQQRQLDELEAKRAFLESVLRQMPVGLVLTEAPSGKTLLTSDSVEQVLGHKPVGCQTLDDMTGYSAIHPDGRPFSVDDYAHARSIKTGEVVVNLENHYLRGDGTRGVVSVTSAPVRDALGHIVAAVAIFFDATQAQRARLELRQAKEVAEAASAAKDHFLAILSHELRTPLTPVLALLSDLSSRTDLPAELCEDLKTIRHNVELEARLIDDLLDLTRVSRGKLELNIETLDIHDLIRRTLATCCTEDIAQKQLTVTLALDSRRSHVRGDAARLSQVFWNLISNAVKFTPEGGTITLRTSNDHRRLNISITDTGIGIEPDALPRLFNAFEQGDPFSHRRFGGMGLGLAICRALVELHGGTITAASDGIGKGATFTVELTATDDVFEAAPTPAEPPTPTPGKNRILLVEDHEDTARIMGRLLAAQGYQVIPATTAEEALTLARADSFNLIVSDLGLPDRSGLELVSELRALLPVPAIALSGFGMDDDIEKSKAAGFAEHLTKPVNFQSLLNAIRRLLS